MSIPMVTMPEQGQIQSRPRRQPIFDTEGDNDAAAIPAKLTLFNNFTAFQVSGLALSKRKDRDTNLEGTGGQLPKGTVHHWYSVTAPVRIMNAGLTTSANAVVFEECHRIRQARWFTFRFGETPFIRAQFDEIPAGVGLKDVQTTHPTITVFDIANGRLARDNRYDVTLDGYPTVITEQEKFATDLETDSGFQPSPTVELYWSVFLWGTLLVGIQG